jgi:hypothetical protein
MAVACGKLTPRSRNARVTPDLAQHNINRHPWIREPRQIHGLTRVPSPYQRPDLILHVPHIDVHPREHTPVLDPECDELRVGIRADRRCAAMSRLPGWRLRRAGSRRRRKGSISTSRRPACHRPRGPPGRRAITQPFGFTRPRTRAGVGVEVDGVTAWYDKHARTLLRYAASVATAGLSTVDSAPNIYEQQS